MQGVIAVHAPARGRVDSRYSHQVAGVYSGMHTVAEVAKRRKKAKAARKARLQALARK
jgi:hypothetical protein